MNITVINKSARPTHKLLSYNLLEFLNKLCDNPHGKSPNVHVGLDQVDLSSTNTTTAIFLPNII
jgi:hypothetical protein